MRCDFLAKKLRLLLRILARAGSFPQGHSLLFGCLLLLTRLEDGGFGLAARFCVIAEKLAACGHFGKLGCYNNMGLFCSRVKLQAGSNDTGVGGIGWANPSLGWRT